MPPLAPPGSATEVRHFTRLLQVILAESSKSIRVIGVFTSKLNICLTATRENSSADRNLEGSPEDLFAEKACTAEIANFVCSRKTRIAQGNIWTLRSVTIYLPCVT